VGLMTLQSGLVRVRVESVHRITADRSTEQCGMLLCSLINHMTRDAAQLADGVIWWWCICCQ